MVQQKAAGLCPADSAFGCAQAGLAGCPYMARALQREAVAFCMATQS